MLISKTEKKSCQWLQGGFQAVLRKKNSGLVFIHKLISPWTSHTAVSLLIYTLNTWVAFVQNLHPSSRQWQSEVDIGHCEVISSKGKKKICAQIQVFSMETTSGAVGRPSPSCEQHSASKLASTKDSNEKPLNFVAFFCSDQATISGNSKHKSKISGER